MDIRVLPDHVINCIAAGEIIERPASVVRELVDNAIDAGSTRVEIFLERGGRSLIRVTDDGKGMSRDDAVLAFERHATSKLSSVDDLQAISTRGFRGEALASIAAVANVTLRTRRREDELGTLVEMFGGKLLRVDPLAFGEGTDIAVASLFTNTPARKKFLKTPQTEEQRVKDWLRQYSFGCPQVGLRLVSDARPLLDLPAVSTWKARCETIFPERYVYIDEEINACRIFAFLCHPGEALSRASGLSILVNGRVIQDRAILRAIREGYDSTLKSSEYPQGCLALEVDPRLVDVNVHPQKMEVRFRDASWIFQIVRGAVLRAVKSFGAPRVHHFQEQAGFPELAPRAIFSPTPKDGLAVQEKATWYGSEAMHRSASGPQAGPEEEIRYSSPHFSYSSLRYIGQVLGCYLLCEYDEHFVVLDMHAAHERINFNKLRSRYMSRELKAQTLLVPLPVQCSPSEALFLRDIQDDLQCLGIGIAQNAQEEQSDGNIFLEAIPESLNETRTLAFVQDLLGIYADEDAASLEPSTIFARYQDAIFARLACHASVRSGDILEREEAYALLAALDEAELAGACPHGRPLLAQFSRAMVERWFGRDR